jgi:enoyl-CoA hydratase
MLHDTSTIRVTADEGIATLWLAFPGGSANRFHLGRLRQFQTAIRVVRETPGLEMLVVRSGKPGGFCDGFETTTIVSDADAARFATFGQQVMTELAEFPLTTVAFLEGPCLGPGLELALACDKRLAVARPDSWFGLGDLPTCWGGRTRLEHLIGRRKARWYSRDRFTAREAAQHRLIDHSFCARRAKIELRSCLDSLRGQPKIPRSRPWFQMNPIETGFAQERRLFRARVREGFWQQTGQPDFDPLNPVQALVTVGLVGGQHSHLAAEFALRGCRVRVADIDADTNPKTVLEPALKRGRVTPLETVEAAMKISIESDAESLIDCDLVILDETASAIAGQLERELPACVVLAVPVHSFSRVAFLANRPERIIGCTLTAHSAEIIHDDATPDTLAAATQWFQSIGLRPTVSHHHATVSTLLPV